jgi:hypothetical protein
MKYTVKEIFYTLQGEGAQSGRAPCSSPGCFGSAEVTDRARLSVLRHRFRRDRTRWRRSRGW